MGESIDLARQKSIPFRVNRGQEIDCTLVVLNSSAASFPFSGYTADLFVYNSFNKTDSEEYEINVTLLDGSMRFTHAAIDRKRKNLVYKLWLTDPTGYRQIWFNGPFLILDEDYDYPIGDSDTLSISPGGDEITINVSPIGQDLPLDIKVVTGTTYTVLEEDNGKMIHYTNNSGVSITLPDDLSNSHITQHIKKGTGDLTFSAETTLQSSGDTIATQYNAALAIHEGSNVWGLYGALT
jgi:hypothetical protein